MSERTDRSLGSNTVCRARLVFLRARREWNGNTSSFGGPDYCWCAAERLWYTSVVVLRCQKDEEGVGQDDGSDRGRGGYMQAVAQLDKSQCMGCMGGG